MTNEEYFARGKNALLYFHNRALRYSGYKLSFEQLVATVENRGYKNFLRGLGMGIIDGEIPEYNVRGGMEKLADGGRGQIPASNGAFTQAIATNAAENISYVDAAAYVAVESGKQIGTAVVDSAQTLGNSLIQVGGVINFAVKYWYFSIPLGIGIYLYSQNYLLEKSLKLGKMGKK